MIVRALSTCSPTSLVRAGLDSSARRAAREGHLRRAPDDEDRTRRPHSHRPDLRRRRRLRRRARGPLQVDQAGDQLRVQLVRTAQRISARGFPGHVRSKIIELDTVRMLGHFSTGITIPLHPFFGSVGVAPPASMGRVNSAPPGIHAGNLDNKELVAGTTLYIPVWTKGALLEIGDGHAGQGNGEVDITAMETSLIGHLQLVVRKDMHLTWPRAETPTHYIAMGVDSALMQATKIAVRQAIELLVQVKGMSREDAYQLVSVAATWTSRSSWTGRTGST